jgi:hypothetical protein
MRGQFNLSPMNVLLGLVILLAGFMILYAIYTGFASSTVQAVDEVIFGAIPK